jgi:hypothetical protein
MLEFKQALTFLQNSETFKDYQKSTPDSYLTNSLYIDDWQINYFSQTTSQITEFTINSKVIRKTLQAENKKFPKLNETKVNTDLKKALEISKIFNIENNKTIAVLQTENNQPIWNITIPLPSLKIIHIKLSASTGSILEQSEKNIIEIKR